MKWFLPRLTLMLALLVLIGTMMWAAPQSHFLQSVSRAPRTGYDPLSLAEQELALQQFARQAPLMARELRGAQHTEVLLVERHQEPKAVVTSQKSWPRRADVYMYLYDRDILLHALVNLESRKVEKVERTQDVQLPLTENERIAAQEKVLNNPGIQRAIEAQYQRITGNRLKDAKNPGKELQMRALIFRADAMPGRAQGEGANCGRQRCAQLLISTEDNVLIDLLPVVNLSRGKVVSADGFFDAEPEAHDHDAHDHDAHDHDAHDHSPSPVKPEVPTKKE